MSSPYDGSGSSEVLRLWKWGTSLIWFGLILGQILILYFAWVLQENVFIFAALPLAIFAGVYLVKHPDQFLYLAIAGFALISSHEAGIQITEILYSLILFGFLGYWYLDKLYLRKERLIYTSVDWALTLFLLYALVSSTWAVFMGAKISTIIGESLVLIMMAFYFPVKNLIKENASKAIYILIAIGFLGVFASIRNIFEYVGGLTSAEKLYQIATGRASLNEVLLMMPALGAFTFLLYEKRWKYKFFLAGFFVLFFVSLIMTQSRGYWLAFFAGALALFLLTDFKKKGGILFFLFSGIAGFLFAGFLLFPAYLPLVLGGIIDRLASLGTALTSDISLVNRFYEAKAAFEYVKVNPILGYGIGTPYSYFNIIYDHNREWSFIHNGYVGLWFKYGIIGLGLFMYFWLMSIYSGISTFKKHKTRDTLSVILLASAICMIGELLVANTSTPFQSEDILLMLTLMGALIAGIKASRDESNALPVTNG